MSVVCQTATCPLTYERAPGGVPVTGLTITVRVVHALTGAQLLAPTACPEVVAGSGIYTYGWVHGLIVETPCIATYSGGPRPVQEDVLIKFSGYPAQGA